MCIEQHIKACKVIKIKFLHILDIFCCDNRQVQPTVKYTLAQIIAPIKAQKVKGIHLFAYIITAIQISYQLLDDNRNPYAQGCILRSKLAHLTGDMVKIFQKGFHQQCQPPSRFCWLQRLCSQK